MKIEKKVTTDYDHDKYITTQEFILTTNLVVRSAQSNLRSKCYIADFIKEIDFDDKLKKLDENVASSKTKNELVENELNEISEKVNATSTKRLTKDLTNKFSIFNVAK